MVTVRPIVVTVRVDTREAEKRLWLLRFSLWLDGLFPRLRRWLAWRMPIARGEIFRLQKERDEARALAGEMHMRYWSLLAAQHRQRVAGKN